MAKRAFRKLSQPRGCVTIGQMFRATTVGNDDQQSDNLNADEIRVRSRQDFEREVAIEELSSAGTSFLKSELPDQVLNSELNCFRCRYDRKSVLSSDNVLCFVQKNFSSKMIVFSTIMLVAALAAYFAKITPNVILSFGLLCHTLFDLIFGPAEERQFELWSTFWSGACKLSESKVIESKRDFASKKSISKNLKIFVSLTLLHIYGISNHQLLCSRSLQLTSLCMVLSVLRKVSKLKLILLLVILAPQIHSYSSPNFGVQNFILTITKCVDEELWSSTADLISSYFSATILALFALFSKDPDALKLTSLAAVVNVGSKMRITIFILAFGLFVTSVRTKFHRFRTFLIVGLIVTLLCQLDERGLLQIQPSDNSSPKPLVGLTWSKFNQICPKNGGDISSKIFCSNFIGRAVMWEGRVTDVNLEKTTAFGLKSAVWSLLPNVVKRIITEMKSQAKRGLVGGVGDSFCHFLKSDLKQRTCDTWANEDDLSCRVAIEMSRSLFSSGDSQRISGIVEDLEQCLKLKAGSYYQFVAEIEDVLNEIKVRIQTFKAL